MMARKWLCSQAVIDAGQEKWLSSQAVADVGQEMVLFTTCDG
jgi:hypothetical protein